jgi:hypothetical protein
MNGRTIASKFFDEEASASDADEKESDVQE